MGNDTKVVNIIKSRIEKVEYGTLFFNNSFPEFDDEYVGKILVNLASDGTLIHLSRGVYLKAKKTEFGIVYPPMEEIAKAIAKRDSAQILPTGATALNVLGLSTQVPMNVVYLTSGSARVIPVGNRTITFRRATPKNFEIEDKTRSLIVQALKAIGEANLTEEELAYIQQIILKNASEGNLKKDIAKMPSWIRKIFKTTLKNHC